MKNLAQAGAGSTLAVSVVLFFQATANESRSEAAAAPKGEALATFEARDWLAFDWQSTLVTYRVQFPPGRAFAGSVRLVDDAGTERPCQLSRSTKHGDGSIDSAWVSFRTGLKAGGRYRYRLLAEAPA